MQLTNFYYSFKDAIPKETCEEIIKLGTQEISILKEKGVNTEGYTFGHNDRGSNPDAAPQQEYTKEQLSEKGINNTYIRDSEVAWLNAPWIYDAVVPFIKDANKLADWEFEWDWCESAQFTVYHPGGFYSWHQDGGGGPSTKYKRYLPGITDLPEKNGRLPESYVMHDNMVGKIRKLSMTLNLSPETEYDGGNLQFDFGPHTNQRFHTCENARSQGSIIVFPSFVHHCVAPITRGTRYSLVIWCLGRPFK
jgi:PKHD-type hydroxylase